MMNDERDSSGNLIDKRKYGISRENINVDDVRKKAFGTLENDIEREIEKKTVNKIYASVNKVDSRFEELHDKIEKEIKDFENRLDEVEKYDNKIWKTIGCGMYNISNCFEKDNFESVAILEEKNRHAEEMKDKEIEMEKIRRGMR